MRSPFLGAARTTSRSPAGFLEIAEIATRHWMAHGPNDGLPIPILFNYRHGIELTLKWLIRLTARCLVRDGHTREDLSPAPLDKKLQTHNIKKLADRLDRYMGLLQTDTRTTASTARPGGCSTGSTARDQTGEAFRYAVIGHGLGRRAARPDQVSINFYEQVNELHQLAALLHDGYASFLDTDEDMQVDYYEWLDSQAP